MFEVDWKTFHRSRLVCGVLQILAAGLISVLFPHCQESNRAQKQEILDLLEKQEEILATFTKTISFSVSLNDDIRACHYRLDCDLGGSYTKSCEAVIVEGRNLSLSAGDTYESVCSIAEVYFSDSLIHKIETLKNSIDALFSYPLCECTGNDDKYRETFERIQNIEYPSVVSGMRDEIFATRKKLRR